MISLTVWSGIFVDNFNDKKADDWKQVGIKWKFKDQTNTFPVAITGLSSIVYRTERNYLIPENEDKPINRLSYSAELYVSKLIGDRLILQLSPTFTYRNLVADRGENHAVYSQGFIAGYKLSQKVNED